MEESRNLLILLPAEQKPEEPKGLLSVLKKLGIKTEFRWSSEDILPDNDHPVLNLTDSKIPTAKKIYRYKKHHISATVDRLELHFSDGNELIPVVSGDYRKFRDQLAELIQVAYLLEKSLKQFPSLIRPLNNETPNHKPVGTRTPGKLSKFFSRDNWHVAIIHAPIHEVVFSKQKLPVISLHPATQSVLRADPFGITIEDESYVFYEKQGLDEKGVIACFYRNKERIVLQKDWHLSYPYVLLEEGKIYCVPEQHETGRTDLYMFDPQEMKLNYLSCILPDFSASDPTIVHHNDRYWLFCTDSRDNGANCRLHLFYADKLEGPWKAHGNNPLKFSVFGARPAGSLFQHEGQLFRPAQNNSETYGGSVMIFRIDVLTDTDYVETLVHEVIPGKLKQGMSGIHTISAMGGSTLVDFKEKVFSFRNLFHTLRKN